jgi:hypothetical protein
VSSAEIVTTLVQSLCRTANDTNACMSQHGAQENFSGAEAPVRE